jgi:hypothetical protein
MIMATIKNRQPTRLCFPGVTAQSDRYELVGVLKNGKFSMFVDDAASNQPVTDVNMQVTIGDTAAIKPSAARTDIQFPFLIWSVPDRRR